MFYATFNIQSFTTPLPLLLARGFRRLMFSATFNNVSVIYHSFAVGRGFRRLMFSATFNNVSVFYHTCAVVRGYKRLMFYSNFNIQSFTTPLL
jgi:hypothetical protein